MSVSAVQRMHKTPIDSVIGLGEWLMKDEKLLFKQRLYAVASFSGMASALRLPMRKIMKHLLASQSLEFDVRKRTVAFRVEMDERRPELQ
jgi:hypothetical protein